MSMYKKEIEKALEKAIEEMNEKRNIIDKLRKNKYSLKNNDGIYEILFEHNNGKRASILGEIAIEENYLRGALVPEEINKNVKPIKEAIHSLSHRYGLKTGFII